jgi:hypothetical protein
MPAKTSAGLRGGNSFSRAYAVPANLIGDEDQEDPPIPMKVLRGVTDTGDRKVSMAMQLPRNEACSAGLNDESPPPYHLQYDCGRTI